MASVLKRRDTDMTEGSIPRLLIYFALPLMIGNVFQQLYNTVDSIVVGNYVSKQALAAVGCTGPVINALFGLFGGLAAGAGVVISQFYGAHDKEKLHKTVQTTIAMSLVMCVVLTALGVWLTPMMLELMSTPEDVMADATEYLRIYFWGISGVIMYYIGAGILRAVGDSTRPLYFLIFSALTNTVLDVVFVKYFSMGIAGAAIATVIAQVLSAVLVMLLLIRCKADYRIDCRDLHITRSILSKICAIGIPVRAAACYNRVLEHVCSVVHKPLRKLLHGRMDGLQQGGLLRAAADDEPVRRDNDLCRAESRRGQL